jgi:hypothetical protein
MGIAEEVRSALEVLLAQRGTWAGDFWLLYAEDVAGVVGIDAIEEAAERLDSKPDEKLEPFRIDRGAVARCCAALVTHEQPRIERAYALIKERIVEAEDHPLRPTRQVARIAAAAGDVETSWQISEAAISWARQTGARPELAKALAEYGEFLRRRDGPGDLALAGRVEEESLTLAGELRMKPLTENLIARRKILRA